LSTTVATTAVLEILGTDLYADEDHADDEPGETKLGLAYGSGGGYQAAAANDVMLWLAETLRCPRRQPRDRLSAH
jgi:hypothetical protein